MYVIYNLNITEAPNLIIMISSAESQGTKKEENRAKGN